MSGTNCKGKRKLGELIKNLFVKLVTTFIENVCVINAFSINMTLWI